MSLLEVVGDNTIILDAIRTGPDYSKFWLVRDPDEIGTSFDLLLKFSTDINKKRFKPIPAIVLPAENKVILKEWIDFTTQDGVPIKALQCRPGVTGSSFKLPYLTSTTTWNDFLLGIESTVSQQKREMLRDHQSEIRKLALSSEQTIAEASTLNAQELTNTKDLLSQTLAKTTEIKKELCASLDTTISVRNDLLLANKKIAELTSDISTLNVKIIECSSREMKLKEQIANKEAYIRLLQSERQNKRKPPNQNQARQRQHITPSVPPASLLTSLPAVATTSRSDRSTGDTANQLRAAELDRRARELDDRERALTRDGKRDQTWSGQRADYYY